VRPYDVMLFDAYFCDLIVTGLPELPQLGKDLFGTDMGIEAGGIFNSARALHRLGIDVGWVCDFGSDLFSQFVLTEIRKEGIDTSLFRIHDKPVRSFSLSFSYVNDRGFISYMDPLEPVDRASYLLNHRPKALLSNDLRPDDPGWALLRTARDVGTTVFLDCQATDMMLQTPGFREMLRAVDVLMLNVSEAMQISGASDRDAAGMALAELTPLVVLKSGADGAYAYSDSGITHSPGLAVNVIDTTGAGDCFNAGFIAAHLRRETLESCLQLGNICGGLSTTAHGTAAAPTLAEAMQHIRPANR
jgi:sugar/nucleoside kinase (ribokinase family)